ncbi:hypothetical protein N7497_002227 [Penicillium chrysogenum]|nr:hypothetical protein N7497_002227 [Penicillium chrysogenum]
MNDPATYPLASEVKSNIPIYDLAALEAAGLTSDLINRLQDEWHHILHTGPGVYVLRSMYAPAKYETTLNTTNAAFNEIIAREAAQSDNKKGDHFASASLAQVNAVHPGGAAQEAHRDYHLGFQEEVACKRYPATTQLTSQFLTLQGAVAHTDMPVVSGPTRFLPFSQTYKPGYLAWRKAEFRDFFQERYVALPLSFGDGLFFNPALFHAAGANLMDPEDGGVQTLVVLLGSLWRRLILCRLLRRLGIYWFSGSGLLGGVLAGQELDPETHSLEQRGIRAFVQAVAEGYPFPTNLDRRPPGVGGMAPESEQDIIVRGLQAGWDRKQVVAALEKMHVDSRA